MGFLEKVKSALELRRNFREQLSTAIMYPEWAEKRLDEATKKAEDAKKEFTKIHEAIEEANRTGNYDKVKELLEKH